jgi:hypothetical protein
VWNDPGEDSDVSADIADWEDAALGDRISMGMVGTGGSEEGFRWCVAIIRQFSVYKRRSDGAPESRLQKEADFGFSLPVLEILG